MRLVLKAVWALCASVFSPVPTPCSNLLVPKCSANFWLAQGTVATTLTPGCFSAGGSGGLTDFLWFPPGDQPPGNPKLPLSCYPPDPRGKQNCWMVLDTRSRPEAGSGQPKFSIEQWLRQSPVNLPSHGQSRDRFLSLRGKGGLAASPGPSELMRFLLRPQVPQWSLAFQQVQIQPQARKLLSTLPLPHVKVWACRLPPTAPLLACWRGAQPMPEVGFHSRRGWGHSCSHSDPPPAGFSERSSLLFNKVSVQKEQT